MTFRIILQLSGLLSCLCTGVALGQTLIGSAVPLPSSTSLSNELQAAQLIALNSQAFLTMANQKTWIQLKIAQHDWQLQLEPDPIFTTDYALTLSTPKGLKQQASQRIQTFSGKMSGAEQGTCRLTLAEGFIYGVFELENKTYFIEPARRFKQHFDKDQYLFYEAADVRLNPDGRCAGALYEEGKSMVEEATEKSAGECYTVDVAIAADYKMLQLFDADVSLLEKYVVANLNNVRSNYDNEFNHQIRFELSTTWVATCETCDPWGEDTNYENLLAIFRDWGNANGFAKNFDVATLWTGRVLDDNVGGGGYYGVLCGRLRYNVLRRYSENAGLMRALQAHELGHNLNARHDSINSLTIMSPFIRDVYEWSPMSKVSINNYFSSALNLPNCISPCQETAPAAGFFAFETQGCAPLNVQFYNTSSANATDWEWIFEGGMPATSAATNPSVSYKKPGIYNVTLRAYSLNGTNEVVKSALIEVKGPSKPAFTIEYQVGTTTAKFAATVAADSLRWHLGTNHTTILQSFSFDFQQDGNYPVTLVTYNECGTDSLTQFVNIVTPPMAGFSAANFIGCAPLAVQFNNESSANASEFFWQFNGGTPLTSTEKNPMVVFEKPGVYSVSLMAKNAAGEVTKRLSNLVQVNNLPSAGFSVKTDLNVAIFRNLSERGTVHYWNFGDGTTTNSTNPVHTYTIVGQYEVELIAKNECGSDTTVKTIEIFGLPPSAAFTADVQQGCAPLTVTFSDASNNEPETWQWYFPGGEPASSNEQNPVIQYLAPGTYAVELITTNFFGSDTLRQASYLQLADKPVADFNFIIENQQVTCLLVGEVQRAHDYFWNFGDDTTSVQPEPAHSYQTPGNYEITLIVRNECGADTIRKTVQIGTTSTQEAAWLQAFHLYPNPSDGHFYLQLQGTPQPYLRLRTLNALGQVLQQQTVDFYNGNCRQYFDFQYFAPGVYWLELQSNTGIVKKAFILQKS